MINFLLFFIKYQLIKNYIEEAINNLNNYFIRHKLINDMQTPPNNGINRPNFMQFRRGFEGQ